MHGASACEDATAEDEASIAPTKPESIIMDKLFLYAAVPCLTLTNSAIKMY